MCGRMWGRGRGRGGACRGSSARHVVAGGSGCDVWMHGWMWAARGWVTWSWRVLLASRRLTDQQDD